ncbi:MAG: methylmalonyl Co-A mutase-associated GTPase MeaB [Anaerolineae bacterium]|jgi:LAO/AO transport system kinase|nr:methylmalonyl Co-A mutase-associated GTPase MeaB [Anaerolineae bacterium]
MATQDSVTGLVEPLLAGNRRALARAISQVEDEAADSHALLAALYPHTGRSHIVGVTGAPGTGKSTLVNALARAFRGEGKTVGIIAVDPTSPFSGGALLGDRVRMRDLAGDPGVFIRSMATRGSLGGLARATGDALSVLDAAGFDRILVETVGVGQAEIDIAAAAHTTVVVEAPGLGDEVQAIKAGVLEIADVFAVNKADRDGADHTMMALQMMQGLAPATQGHHRPASGHGHAEPGAQGDGSWLPPIVKTVAVRGEGVAQLAGWIERHREYLAATGQLSRREEARAANTLDHILRDRLLAELTQRLPDGYLRQVAGEIARREHDPYSVVDRILSAYGCP